MKGASAERVSKKKKRGIENRGHYVNQTNAWGWLQGKNLKGEGPGVQEKKKLKKKAGKINRT